MIDELLANYAERATEMRRFGAAGHADAITALVAELKADPGVRAYLTWHPEADAAVASGHHADWFRQRYAYFEKLGLARRQGRIRQYRETLVRAVSTSAALDAARQDAENAVKGEAA